jgi:CubicO group peptidase (beta-lactamase class C family)
MTKSAGLFLLCLVAQAALYGQQSTITLTGTILDSRNKPIPYASVGIPAKGIGTISNRHGAFYLKIPATIMHDTLIISSLGYNANKIVVSALDPSKPLITQLSENHIVMEEVVIKPLDPVALIRTAIGNIPRNYHNTPHATNGFYRIDTKKGNEHIMLSEAVFDVYNAGYGSSKKSQFRLTKMRSIQDEQASHGLDLGLKPKSIFDYDLVKEIADHDLFSKTGMKNHRFRLVRIIAYNGINAYEISFDQKEDVKESLFKGKLYLDVNDLAFIAIDMGRSPKGIAYAKYGDVGTRALMKLIGLHIDIQKDDISVRYKKFGNKWVLSSVRNDNVLKFKSNRAFYDFKADIRVDYIITGIDTAATAFADKETLGNNKFIEYQADKEAKDFWKDHNIMLADYNSDTIAYAIRTRNATYDLKTKIEKRIKKLPKDKVLRIDSILSFFHANGNFNGMALIKHEGKVILRKGYGLADRERNLPVTDTTEFRIGSLTKSFTSLLIFQLALENKFSTHDSIGKFIPGYVHGHVTIADLLTHTSGIPNYTSRSDYLGEMLLAEMPLRDIITKYCSDSLEFKPGEGFRYSNSGYLILAAILETATGSSYEQLLNTRIFTPLKMTRSGFGTAGNSRGYWYGQPEPVYDIKNVTGAGGIFSTADDLLKWDEALYTSQLMPVDKINDMFRPLAEYADWDAYYGCGWMIDKNLFGQSRKHTIIYHPGTDLGYYTMFVRQGDTNSLIVLLNNTGDFPRFDMTDLILEELN